MSFRHNVKPFVPKTYDKPYFRGRGRGGFVPKPRGRGYVPSDKSHFDRKSYSPSPKHHSGVSKHRRSYSRSSSGSFSSSSSSRSRSRSRGEKIGHVGHRRRSPHGNSHHVSSHKSRDKKKLLSPEKLRHRPEPSKSYQRASHDSGDEHTSSKYKEFSGSAYPPSGGGLSGVSLLGPAIPAPSYITLRTSALALPHKPTLSERFTGPMEKPFKAGENVTIGIHRNIKLSGGRVPPPVNRRFNPDLFVMVHKRDYITQPIFNREEILKFRFDVELDDQLVQEKRVISVSRDEHGSSKDRHRSPFHDDPHHSKKSLGMTMDERRLSPETSGYRSRMSAITSSDLPRSGLSDMSRDTGLYGRAHQEQKVSRLAPSPDPRYEQLLREPEISDRPSGGLHLNPGDLRYNLMKRKQSDSIGPIDYPAKKRYTPPLLRSPERPYDLSPRRRSHSPFERRSRSLSPVKMPSGQRNVIDGSRNRSREMSPGRFPRKENVFSELDIPRKRSFSREHSFTPERKMSLERVSLSPSPRSMERRSFSRSPVRGSPMRVSPVRGFSRERSMPRSRSRSRDRHMSSEKKSDFRKKDSLSVDKPREHVSKRDEKPRRDHKPHISSIHQSRGKGTFVKDFNRGRGRGFVPRGNVFRGRIHPGRGTFRGTDRRLHRKEDSAQKVKDHAPRKRSEDRRSGDRQTDDRQSDKRRTDERRTPEDDDLTDFKSQLVDLFLQQSETEAPKPFMHDNEEDAETERLRPKERLNFRGRGNRGTFLVPRTRGPGFRQYIPGYVSPRYLGNKAWGGGRGRPSGSFAPRGRGYVNKYRDRSPSGKWKHDKFDRHTDAPKE